MKISGLLSNEQGRQVIAHAIERNLPVTMTHRAGDGWHLYKSKSFFASGSVESSSVCVEMAVPAELPDCSLPRRGDPIGMTFRLNRRKCVFNSAVLAVEQRHGRLLVTVRWPNELQQIQRRAFERAPVPPGRVIPVRFWRDDGGIDGPHGGREVRSGQLDNLSAGGLQIKVAHGVDVHMGSIYKCVFSIRPGAPALIMDARLRHREVVEQGRSVLGFQLIGLDTTPEGCLLLDRLARIVSEFQRAARRAGNVITHPRT